MRSTLKNIGFILFVSSMFVFCKKPAQDSLSQKKPPVAYAGPDKQIFLPRDSVEIMGSGTDEDGRILTYSWTKISGPNSLMMIDQDKPTVKIKKLVRGIYEFELKVGDDDGLSHKDVVLVTVADTQIHPPPPGISCPIINGLLVPVQTPSGNAGRPVATVNNKILFFSGGNSVSIYDISANTWIIGQLSLTRQSMAISSIGDKVFFAGGAQVTELWPGEYLFTLTTRVDIYNATTNNWSIAELSQPRELFAAASAGNKILFAGGVYYNNTVDNYQPPISSATVDIYDISTNTWSVDSLSQARSSLSATVSGSKIYFAGGVSGTGTSNAGFSSRIDIYDAVTNSWTVSLLDCEGKAQMASIAAENKIFWAGGSTSFVPVYTNKVEIRDVNSQNSTCVHLCHSQGAWHTDGDAVLKDNKVVFFNRYEGTFEVYDLSEDKWYLLVPNLLIRGGGIICVNNTIYFAGGSVNGAVSNQLWKLEF